jgi:hypothetical protein
MLASSDVEIERRSAESVVRFRQYRRVVCIDPLAVAARHGLMLIREIMGRRLETGLNGTD